VGTTVGVGVLLALSLALALLLYWRYREEESHYLQVQGHRVHVYSVYVLPNTPTVYIYIEKLKLSFLL
jgi:hypothetical protein